MDRNAVLTGQAAANDGQPAISTMWASPGEAEDPPRNPRRVAYSEQRRPTVWIGDGW